MIFYCLQFLVEWDGSIFPLFVRKYHDIFYWELFNILSAGTLVLSKAQPAGLDTECIPEGREEERKRTFDSKDWTKLYPVWRYCHLWHPHHKLFIPFLENMWLDWQTTFSLLIIIFINEGISLCIFLLFTQGGTCHHDIVGFAMWRGFFLKISQKASIRWHSQLTFILMIGHLPGWLVILPLYFWVIRNSYL